MPKINQSFRIEQSLSQALDKLCTRHGDKTWHVESALKLYLPTLATDNSTLPALVLDKPKKQSKRFTPPTAQEAGNYFLERGSTDAVNEADKFIDFYTSKGWKVGKNPMKDWKATIRNWMRSSNERHQSDNRPTAQQSIGDALHGATAHDW